MALVHLTRGLAVAALTTTSFASRPSEAADRPRDAFSFDGAVGFGWTAGSYEFEHESAPFDGTPAQRLRFEAGLEGPVLALTAMPAYAIGAGLSLGVVVDAMMFPALEQQGQIGESNIGGALLLGGAAALVIRPARVGFEGALSLGLQRATLYGSTHDIASAENVYEHEPALGPRTALRCGYVFESGFGVATTASLAWLGGEHSSYRPLVVVFQAALSRW